MGGDDVWEECTEDEDLDPSFLTSEDFTHEDDDWCNPRFGN